LLSGEVSISFISVSEMNDPDEKAAAYKNLLSKLGTVEYCTLKKILGHLHFIQSLSAVNKMSAENLAMVFGVSLLGSQNQMEYSHRECDVVTDLIYMYKILFDLTEEEIKKEQIMLKVLTKYHSAAENLHSEAKHSGDLKIWIYLNSKPDENLNKEELDQVLVSLTPSKTCFDVCRELSLKLHTEPHKLCLVEKILNGELERPLHHTETLLNCTLNWTQFTDEDKKNNYFEIKPLTAVIQQIDKSSKQLIQLPQQTLSFANNKTKSLKQFVLELCDDKIYVRKKEKITDIVKEFHIDSKLLVYFGMEKKRELGSHRWSMTFVELDGGKIRNPYFGNVVCGADISNEITVRF
jgi:hypothetical protein